MTDYYNLLGVPQNATTHEIKTAYRQLALKYHPDRNPEDVKSEAFFKKVTEAYTVLSDPEKREKYNREYSQSQQRKDDQNERQSTTDTTDKAPITPQNVLAVFIALRKKVAGIPRHRINHSAVYKSLDELLSTRTIDFLIKWGDTNTNKFIIDEALACCTYLAYPFVEKLSQKLARLALSDNDAIQEIYKFSQKRRRKRSLNKRGLLIGFASLICILMLMALLKPKETYIPQDNARSSEPANGDLNSTFIKDQPSPTVKEKTVRNNPPLSPEEKLQQEKERMVAAGWEESNVDNGQLPSCYNYIPKRGSIDNYLEVHVGGGTDVAIKVMNLHTNKCIRYVFINSGTTYKIRNIPEGKYYLKIAYGKEWFSRVEDGKCVGKFLRNPLYEKGEEIMDYNLQYTDDGYNIPSFQLKLDVIASNSMNTFSSHDISEGEFNR